MYDASADMVYAGGGYVDPYTDQWLTQVGGSNPYRYFGNAGPGRTSPADAVSGLGNLLARPALVEPTIWDGYGAELQHNLGVYMTGLTVAFGVAEVIGGGVVGVGAGWTGVGLAAAGALIYSGVDDIQAGVRQLAGDQDAVTSKFVLGREAAELAGADEDTARMVGNITDIGLSVGAGVTGGIVRGTQKAATRAAARSAHAAKMGAIHQRQAVLANIAESRAARESSNFGTHTKRVAAIREEARYGRLVKELEAKHGAPGVHSIERHGAQTTLASQYRRVSESGYPNPTTGVLNQTKTKRASKFISSKDHYRALSYALNKKQAGYTGSTIQMRFNNFVGMSVQNMGTHSYRGPYNLNLTQYVTVRFDSQGRLLTAFPGSLE